MYSLNKSVLCKLRTTNWYIYYTHTMSKVFSVTVQRISSTKVID